MIPTGNYLLCLRRKVKNIFQKPVVLESDLALAGCNTLNATRFELLKARLLGKEVKLVSMDCLVTVRVRKGVIYMISAESML